METDEKLPQELEKEYYSIAVRSFKTKLDIYLFTQITRNKLDELDIKNDFPRFKIGEDIRNDYKIAWTKPEECEKKWGINYKAIDKKIDEWHIINKNSPLVSALRKQYLEDFEIILPRQYFKQVYKEKSEDRECYYCGIKETQINSLKERGLINTKRGRGNKMEIDRESFCEYEKGKIVLACYWCNNAKTDEFSREEFRYTKVGDAIKLIWDERLKFITSNNINK